MSAIYDLFTCGFFYGQPVSLRSLQGTEKDSGGKGIVDLMLFKRGLLDHIMETLLMEMAWDGAIKKALIERTASHGVFRASVGYPHEKQKDLTWRAGWPPSSEQLLEFVEAALSALTSSVDGEFVVCFSLTASSWQATIFGIDYDAVLRNAVKNRRSFGETLDMAGIVEVVTEIREKHNAEKKKTNDRDDADEKDIIAAAAAPASDQDSHMAIVVTTMSSLKLADGSKTIISSAADSERLGYFRKQARRLIQTHVKLIVEPPTEGELAAELSQSMAGQVHGEKGTDRDGQPVHKTMVAVWFDLKLAGEAMSAPHLRTPPLKEGRLPKLMNAVLRSRCRDFNADTAEMDFGDLFVMFDGGKHGNRVQFNQCFKNADGKNLQKQERQIYLSYNERSLVERLKLVRGFGNIHQMEMLYLFSGQALRLATKDRLFWEGTNRGDCLSGIMAEPWSDAAVTWQQTLQVKKQIFGKNRIAVGGANPGDDIKESGRAY